MLESQGIDIGNIGAMASELAKQRQKRMQEKNATFNARSKFIIVTCG
jgi:hypothetical protein